MDDLLFFTSALNDHKNFIVLYSYFAKKFNQNSKFEFLVNNEDDNFNKLIQAFSNEFNIEIKLTYANYPELNGQVIRFLIEPLVKCTYTYIGDIDIFLNENILKFHIDQMNKFETIWDNQQRRNDPTKITGLHFIKSKEWYEQTKIAREKYLNPIYFNKTNDEVILKNIIYESNLNQSKYDDTLRKRPLHGCHISLNRVPFTDKMTFPCELYKEMFIDNFLKSNDYLKIKKYLSKEIFDILNTCTNHVLNESNK